MRMLYSGSSVSFSAWSEDTWSTAWPHDEYDDGVEVENGYIFTLVNSAIPAGAGGQLSKGWNQMEILTDNCADEHVCSLDDFSWAPLCPGPGAFPGVWPRNSVTEHVL